MKRILLFLGTNMAIVLVLSLSMRVLGVEPYLNASGRAGFNATPAGTAPGWLRPKAPPATSGPGSRA